MKLKKTVLLLLSACLIALLIPLLCSASGEKKSFKVDLSINSDYRVYAPGVFDIIVLTDAEEPAYQWYAHVGSSRDEAFYVKLVDNENYSGVNTHHLSMITNNGVAYDVDGGNWQEIYFTCRVTDKYGTSRFGPDVNMLILSHESLLQRLEKDGVRFTGYGISDAAAMREIEGVRYYDVYADKGLSASSSYGLVSDEFKPYFTASEAEIRAETYITEDGKTIRHDKAFYEPHKVGKGVITVEEDLVLYMRGERMETIDRKTYVVNVLTPDGIGAATVKSACRIFSEPNQSADTQILAKLGKGTYVRLLSKSGSYWKVVADGTIGYVSESALNVLDNIGTVGFTVQEPAAYVAVDSVITLDTNGQYAAESKFNQEIWHDDTANRFMKKGDVFQPGHKYTLQVWLTAAAGKRFHTVNGNPSVDAFVNGYLAAAVKAYEQDPEEVIEVLFKFDHVHDLKKVNRVYPTCTEPGKDYYYKCDCGWSFEDSEARIKITDENWGIIPALGHLESEWKSNGTEHYKICLRRECGLVLIPTKGSHVGGTATCRSGPCCTVCGLEYGQKAPHRPGKEATATEPQICLDCGLVLKEPTGVTQGPTGIPATSSPSPSPSPSASPSPSPSATHAPVTTTVPATAIPTGAPATETFTEGQSFAPTDPASSPTADAAATDVPSADPAATSGPGQKGSSKVPVIITVVLVVAAALAVTVLIAAGRGRKKKSG